MQASTGKKNLPRVPRAFAGIASGMVLALVALFRREGRPIVLVYGEGLLIVSIVYLVASWTSYLKRDGVGFLSSRLSGKKVRSADDWKDRVSTLGDPPLQPELPPAPIEGVTPEEAERLQRAEANLQKRISGEALENEDPETVRKRSKVFSRDAAVSGVVLFILSLVFQYLLY